MSHSLICFPRRRAAVKKRRALITLRNRHGNASTGTLSDTPAWARLLAESCGRNFPFRCGQQPKLRKFCLVQFSLVFNSVDAADLTTIAGGCARLIFGRQCVPGAGALDPGGQCEKRLESEPGAFGACHGALQRQSVKTLAGRD